MFWMLVLFSFLGFLSGVFIDLSIIERAVDVKIIADQWRWYYEVEGFQFRSYLGVPGGFEYDGSLREVLVSEELILPCGVDIQLALRSLDRVHSWSVPRLGVRVDAVPGVVENINFILDKPGVYYGDCIEMCGVLESHIPIVVKVLRSKEFFKWVEKEYRHQQEVWNPVRGCAAWNFAEETRFFLLSSELFNSMVDYFKVVAGEDKLWVKRLERVREVYNIIFKRFLKERFYKHKNFRAFISDDQCKKRTVFRDLLSGVMLNWQMVFMGIYSKEMSAKYKNCKETQWKKLRYDRLMDMFNFINNIVYDEEKDTLCKKKNTPPKKNRKTRSSPNNNNFGSSKKNSRSWFEEFEWNFHFGDKKIGFCELISLIRSFLFRKPSNKESDFDEKIIKDDDDGW